MSAKIKASIDMRAGGMPAAHIAAELGVHQRTLRKWWARARKIAGADDPPPEIDAIDASDPVALGDALRRLVARETGAALALSQRDPGAATDALGRLARALKHIPAQRQRDDTEGMSLDELNERICRQVEALAADKGLLTCAACGNLYTPGAALDPVAAGEGDAREKNRPA